jgi:hypothetical protein
MPTSIFLIILLFLRVNSQYSSPDCSDETDLGNCIGNPDPTLQCAWCTSTKTCLKFDTCANITLEECESFVPSRTTCEEFETRRGEISIIILCIIASVFFLLITFKLSQTECCEKIDNRKPWVIGIATILFYIGINASLFLSNQATKGKVGDVSMIIVGVIIIFSFLSCIILLLKACFQSVFNTCKERSYQRLNPIQL